VNVLWTCDCGVVNSPRTSVCEGCGHDRVTSLAVLEPAVSLGKLARACPIDGAPLRADGFCLRGEGYPHPMAYPFRCSLCGHALDWSGGCFACYGTRTGRREEWSMPGDGYYTHTPEGKPIGDGQHWVKQADAGRPAVSAADNAAQKRRVAQLLRPLLGGPVRRAP
jgi:hypothetical protein